MAYSAENETLRYIRETILSNKLVSYGEGRKERKKDRKPDPLARLRMVRNELLCPISTLWPDNLAIVLYQLQGVPKLLDKTKLTLSHSLV